MAAKSDVGSREMESYVDTGIEQSANITLSATPETITTVTLPADVKGFRMYSASNNIRFAVNGTVVAVGASSSQTVAATVFKRGGVVLAGAWETRLLPSAVRTKSTDANRTITLYSLVASTAVTIELF